MEEEHEDYGYNPVDDMMVDYDYHVNMGEFLELFDESSVDDFIANLNDWDWLLCFNYIFHTLGIIIDNSLSIAGEILWPWEAVFILT